MAALTMAVPTGAGVTVTPNTASASDTITTAQLGTAGVNLIARTSGTVCNITISDAGFTPAGHIASVSAVATPATGVKAFYIAPSQADLSTGLVTIGANPITGLTYEVYPA